MRHRAVVVPQLVERSLPIPEVRGLNPAIGKMYIERFSVNRIEIWKYKKKRKRTRKAHLKNIGRQLDIIIPIFRLVGTLDNGSTFLGVYVQEQEKSKLI